MNKKGIKVGSVTLAMKGRDLLQKNGYKAYLTRNPEPQNEEGCGYVIYVNNIDSRCFQILNRAGIKVLGTVDLGDVL
ncbi:MAG: putative Se/S carrier-like protein [Acutalibacteraceae bacterium]